MEITNIGNREKHESVILFAWCGSDVMHSGGTEFCYCSMQWFMLMLRRESIFSMHSSFAITAAAATLLPHHNCTACKESHLNTPKSFTLQFVQVEHVSNWRHKHEAMKTSNSPKSPAHQDHALSQRFVGMEHLCHWRHKHEVVKALNSLKPSMAF